jgi:hypothetical protein
MLIEEAHLSYLWTLTALLGRPVGMRRLQVRKCIAVFNLACCPVYNVSGGWLLQEPWTANLQVKFKVYRAKVVHVSDAI